MKRVRIEIRAMQGACDICVVGGGPAGASTANRLARLGFRVIVVEAVAFPRRHVGESLPLSILPLLDELGVRDDVERSGFLRPDGAIVCWAGSENERPIDAAGFQVDRGRFDALLLRAARQAGAEILQPVVVAHPERVGPFDWRVPIRGHEKYDEIRCRFLVDAAGRRGCLPGKRQRLSVPTLALWAYWLGVVTTDSRTRVEAGADQWYWGAPLPGGEFNATVFIDRDFCRRGCVDLDSTYNQLLSASKLLALCLRGTRVTPVKACTAAISRVEEPVGDDWIKVGESAVAIDPLASQGVVAAVAGGLQAAAVVNTVLRYSSHAVVARVFCRDRVREMAENGITSAAESYRAQAAVFPTAFWQRRAAVPVRSPAPSLIAATAITQLLPDTRLRQSQALRFEPIPVLFDSMIRLELATVHPNLLRPVVWLGGTRLADLMREVDGTRPANEIVQRWRQTMPAETSVQVLHWLWNHGLVTNVLKTT